MSAIFNSKIDAITLSLAKTAEIAAKYGDANSKNINTFEKIISDITRISSNAKLADDAINSSKNLQTVKEFEQSYAKKRDNSRIKIKSESQYKTLMSQIGELLNAGDESLNTRQRCDDDIEMESEISDIDPITKQRMKHPVKNQICGHYYEKESVLQSIQVNPKLRCPVAGCGNKHLIKSAQLIEDVEFTLKLRRMRRSE